MQQSETPFVVKEFEKKAQLFLQRNVLYGDNYKDFGHVMTALFRSSNIQLDLSNPKEMCRLGIFIQMVGKLTRYAQNWKRGGHDDSLDDLAVYTMMLKEIDHEQHT